MSKRFHAAGICDCCDDPRDEDGYVVAYCPSCGVAHEDYDGFGVLTCEMCGYCSHPSITGGRCDSCDRPVPRSRPAAQEDKA